MNGQASITRYLISVAANINAVDDDGCTPLVYAIRAGHADCVEILIENGATVEPISSTAPIPLSIACEHGHSQIVMLLLSKGAQLTADLNGLFPLHLASREGHQDVSRLLLSHGADVDAADGLNGWTPIFYAASEGHLECVQVLLEVGARIDMVDEYGWTPVTYALYRGHIKIAELLELKMDPGFSSKQGQSPPKVDNIKPMAPSELFSAAPDRSNSPTPMDLDLDELPDLSLPPPIIPFRIYGHAFLDKKAHIRVTLKGQSASHPGPVSLKESQQMTSLKLVISGKPEVGVPYHVILPLQDDLEVHTFLVEDTASFSLQFDVFPTFGTKPIGRAVVLPSQIAALTRRRWVGPGEQESAVLPLFDPHLRVVGEVQCNLEIVTPFAHPSLQIGGKVETYWKSTKV
ncbi:ankyrin repeat-containing domain protein [Fimicolochytrium jonesii]|uniref:ankyrin repeat-containing domain protein n=1 Tax=Fimicolochytrium jonesii TaxID=1396493 RepID=UPI0022FEC335|nr:ankyrin repeat-containing domain protein [Fimicolochytrium jonesii]KAI8817707.1 ankyrin repeat-containing domain protein [Fimicolochytrium jonesii]